MSALETSDKKLERSDTTASTGDIHGACRTIGFFGGVCMLTNVVVGPGIVEFPALYQKAGWLLCTLSIVCYALLAIANSWMTIYAHNSLSKRTPERLEFIDMCKEVFPRWAYIVCFIFYVATMYALCLASILQIMQMMDFLVGYFSGGSSCAFEIWGSKPFSWVCEKVDDMEQTAFEEGSGVISIGMVLCALFTVPFGFFPLEDNIGYQSVATLAMYVSIAVWIVTFCIKGLEPSNVPMVGESASRLIGVTLFNFSLPFTLPSWNNERKLSVSPMPSIVASVCWGSGAMVILGIFAAMALPIYYGRGLNVLHMINDNSDGVTFGWPAKAAMFVFTLMNTATGIPVFSIVLRYNFLSKTNPIPFLRNKVLGTFSAVALPWLVALPLYTINGFSSVVDYAGTFVGSVVNFFIPVLLFASVLRMEKKTPLSLEEEARLAAKKGDVLDPSLKTLTSVGKLKAARFGSVVLFSIMGASVGMGLYDAIDA